MVRNFWESMFIKSHFLTLILVGIILAACQTRTIQTPSSSYLLTLLPALDIAPIKTPNETALFDVSGSPTVITRLAATPIGTLESYFLPQMPEDLTSVVIQLSKNTCYGTCPEYAVTIYGDGRVIYLGKQYVSVKGEREYFIPTARVDTLVDLFYEYGFFSWQDEYSLYPTNNPAYTISIRIGDYLKTVIVYPPGASPERFLLLADVIDELSGARELVEG